MRRPVLWASIAAIPILALLSIPAAKWFFCSQLKPKYPGDGVQPAWAALPTQSCLALHPRPHKDLTPDISWSGDCSRCAANGEGTLEWAEQDNKRAKFIGSLARGIPEGIGEFHAADGSIYRGEFDGWQYSGDGTLKMPDGSSFEGQFAAGLRHGRGELTLVTGQRFSGTWARGEAVCDQIEPKYHGKSDSASWIRVQNTDCYVFNPNPVDGETVTWTGDCTDCKAHGTGQFRWYRNGQPGDTLQAHFIDGSPNGDGTAQLTDGTVYKGGFRNWNYHGKGSLAFPDGRSYSGEFADGKYHGLGRWTHPDGDRYEGEFQRGKREGAGKYFFPSGSKYEGNWSDNQRSGQGRMEYSSGIVYDGNWSEDRREGSGSLTWPSGESYTGEFHADVMSSPEKAEAEVLSSCQENIKFCKTEDLTVGQLAQRPASTSNEAYFDFSVANRAAMPARVTLVITVHPYEEKYQASSSVGWGILAAAACGLFDGSLEECLGAGAIAGGGHAAITKNDIAERNRVRERSTVLDIPPGGQKSVTISTGYIQNGIADVRVKSVDISWPNGQISDPTGCFSKWLKLGGSSLTDFIRQSYQWYCKESSDSARCSYLNAVDEGNVVSKLREIKQQYPSSDIGALAELRQTVLGLLY